MSTTVGSHTVGSSMLHTVRNDHQEVQRNIETLLKMTDMDAKQRLFNDTVKMLAQHDVAEEVVRRLLFYAS